MKPSIEGPSLNSTRTRRNPWAWFAVPLLFWPVFLLLTILEEKGGLSWLQTGNAALWRPVAIVALLSAVGAPLFLDGRVPKKVTAMACSLLGFTAIYGVVLLIGVSFLNWGD